MRWPALAITFKPTPDATETITWKRALVSEWGDFAANTQVASSRMRDAYPDAVQVNISACEVGPGVKE